MVRVRSTWVDSADELLLTVVVAVVPLVEPVVVEATVVVVDDEPAAVDEPELELPQAAATSDMANRPATSFKPRTRFDLLAIAEPLRKTDFGTCDWRHRELNNDSRTGTVASQLPINVGIVVEPTPDRTTEHDHSPLVALGCPG